MGEIKLFIVGVSTYIYLPQDKQLPFCKNDISKFKNVIVDVLKVGDKNIFCMGQNGIVSKVELVSALKLFVESAKQDDILIVYYSGHGASPNGRHYLITTDTIPDYRINNTAVSTEEIIDILNNCKSKSKVIFLDCCHSGNFTVGNQIELNIDAVANDFIGSGCSVFASCGSNEYSYSDTDGTTSIFTTFLCDAFRDRLSVRNGRISLYDIKKLVTLYLNKWSERNQGILPTSQAPVFRSNMIGTIFFKVDNDKTIKRTIRNHEKTAKYEIVEVESQLKSMSKANLAKIIIREDLSDDEFVELSKEVTEIVKLKSEFKTEGIHFMARFQPANIVWLYFGKDMLDVKTGTWICRSVWANVDKDWWLKSLGEDCIIYNDIALKINYMYEFQRDLYKESQGEKDIVISGLKEKVALLVPHAEEAITIYNELKNKCIDTDIVYEKITELRHEVYRQFFLADDMPLAPIDIYDYSQACHELFSSITRLFDYFYDKVKGVWDYRAVDIQMDMAVEMYYSALESLKQYKNV